MNFLQNYTLLTSESVSQSVIVPVIAQLTTPNHLDAEASVACMGMGLCQIGNTSGHFGRALLGST